MLNDEKIKQLETMFNEGKIEEAKNLAEDLLKDNEDDARLYYVIGNALLLQNKLEEAKENLTKSVSLNQNLVGALLLLGGLTYKEGDFKKAAGYFARAAKLDPNNDKVYYNLGTAHQAMEDYENALNFYQRAMQINPKDVKNYYNSSLILLRKGDYERGFDLYRLRYHQELPDRPTSLLVNHLPLNSTKDIEDKTILVYDEQGIERTIDFIRFLPSFVEKGAKIVLRVQEPLQKLMSFNYPDITFSHTLNPEDEMTFEGHFPLMDAAYMLKVKKRDVPFKEGYLKVDENDSKEFREKHSIKNDGKNIGIIWKEDENLLPNTTLLEEMVKNLKDESVNIYSLVENVAIEEGDILDDNGIVSLGEDLEDFYDKALAISNMDAVIGIDTPSLHLSGAMGKPTTLLLGEKSDWFWGSKDKKSSLYDSITIYKINNQNYKRAIKKASNAIKI